MNNEGFEPAHIWVITPKTEGCGFPWMFFKRLWVLEGERFGWSIFPDPNWWAIWIAPKSGKKNPYMAGFVWRFQSFDFRLRLGIHPGLTWNLKITHFVQGKWSWWSCKRPWGHVPAVKSSGLVHPCRSFWMFFFHQCRWCWVGSLQTNTPGANFIGRMSHPGVVFHKHRWRGVWTRTSNDVLATKRMYIKKDTYSCFFSSSDFENQPKVNR